MTPRVSELLLFNRLLALVVSAFVVAPAVVLLLSACAQVLLSGATMGATMMYTDRRSSGRQVEDQTIEVQASSRVRDAIGDRGHVTVTSFNRVALITGEVPFDADRISVEQTVTRVEGVRRTVNELAVMPAASMSSRSNDLMLVGMIKAAYIQARDLHVNAFKVVVDRGTVYLMGLVTEREALRATELARSVSGVRKVVRVFHIVSEEDLAGVPGAAAAPPAAAPSAPTSK